MYTDDAPWYQNETETPYRKIPLKFPVLRGLFGMGKPKNRRGSGGHGKEGLWTRVNSVLNPMIACGNRKVRMTAFSMARAMGYCKHEFTGYPL